MKIGIVSDSHGRAGLLGRAVRMLVEHGAEAIVHCGDLGSPDCVAVLAEGGVPAYAVAGNTDGHYELLLDEAVQRGVTLEPECVVISVGSDGQLAATHGNNSARLAEMISGGQYRFVCHGHTHLPRDERIGSTHVINPGALHHTEVTSVALLDTSANTVEHIEVK